ncbi:MAG: rhodanese-like domain-containing protein [Chakrabartia sp.]
MRHLKRRLTLLIALMFSGTAPLQAADTNPLIDYAGFETLTRDVRPQRAKRLLSLSAFKKRASDPAILLLDARSERAFAEGHIAGAVNLPFSDFTAESLSALIGPDANRPILIYCNNNFRNNVRPVVTKSVSLALNIQTFINLVGYGYANVWELGEAVDMNDPKVGWVRG